MAKERIIFRSSGGRTCWVIEAPAGLSFDCPDWRQKAIKAFDEAETVVEEYNGWGSTLKSSEEILSPEKKANRRQIVVDALTEGYLPLKGVDP